MDWIIDHSVSRHVPKGEPFICLFSSGKDSICALSVACMDGGIPVSLIYCNSDEDILDDYIFHWQSKRNVLLQSEMMNIPLEYHEGLWYTWPKTAKKFCGWVKYVVFGDLYLEENFRIQRRLCERIGMIPCFPLWDLSFASLMDKFEQFNIETIITAIDPKSKVPSSWLGKRFDHTAYEYFNSIHIDPFGENGEYHTFVVNCCLFKRRLQYRLGAPKKQYITLDVW